MFEHSAIGIGIMGLDRKVIDMNPAMCRVLGVERQELIGNTPVLATHPDDLPRLLQKAYPRLKIVLLSVDAGDEAAAKKAGADFIHKGAPPDELIATLTPLLRKDT
jgi:PAS domain S-box-containing protein